MKVKNRGAISSFEKGEAETWLSEEKEYGISFLLQARKVTEIMFHIDILNKKQGFSSVRSHAGPKIEVRASLSMKPEDIAQKIYEEIKKHEAGFSKEELFENEVIPVLLKKYPKLIHYAYRVSDYADKKEGIDFRFGYCPPKQDNIFLVEFNLKSSSAHIREHIRKHPKVSTMVFSEDRMLDFVRLERSILHFLSKAVHETVHWR